MGDGEYSREVIFGKCLESEEVLYIEHLWEVREIVGMRLRFHDNQCDWNAFIIKQSLEARQECSLLVSL
jgi:hypothetical protein|eukprot:scaffold1478_cov213-Alexandrium_tamarense.AAC.14